MANNSNSDALVSQEHAVKFCAQLNSKERRVLAYCIDGEICAKGLPDGTRPGSPAFEEARRKAVTEIKRRQINLEELGGEVLVALDEGLDDHDEKVRETSKKTRKRIERYADFLAEEAGTSNDEPEAPPASDDDGPGPEDAPPPPAPAPFKLKSQAKAKARAREQALYYGQPGVTAPAASTTPTAKSNSAVFLPDVEQRQMIGGREFLTLIELEWMPHDQVWDLPPNAIESMGTSSVGRARAARYFVDGKRVAVEEYDEAIIEATRFAHIVGEEIEPAPFAYLKAPPEGGM